MALRPKGSTVRLALVVVATMAAAACSGAPANLSGTWTGTALADGAQAELTLDLVQTDGEIVGTFSIPGAAGTVSGEVEGDFLKRLILEAPNANEEGCAGTLTASGIATGDELGLRLITGSGCLARFGGGRVDLGRSAAP